MNEPTQEQEAPTVVQEPTSAPAPTQEPVANKDPLTKFGGTARVLPLIVAFGLGVFSVFAVQGMTEDDRPQPVGFGQGGPGQMGPPGQGQGGPPQGQFGQGGPGQMGPQQGQDGGRGQSGPPARSDKEQQQTD